MSTWARCLMVLLLGLPRVAAAEEPPDPKRGVWELKRTVQDPSRPGGPQPISRTDCMDLAKDLKAQRAMLERAGCAFEPTKRSGDRYTIEATCKLGDGVISKSRNVTVVKPDGYESTIESETTSGGTTVRTSEKLVARRLRDCP